MIEPLSPPSIHRSNRQSPSAAAVPVHTPAAVPPAVSASISEDDDDAEEEEELNTTFGDGTHGQLDTTFDDGTFEEEEEHSDCSEDRSEDHSDQMSTDHYDSGDEDDRSVDDDGGSDDEERGSGSGSGSGSDYSGSEYDTCDEEGDSIFDTEEDDDMTFDDDEDLDLEEEEEGVTFDEGSTTDGSPSPRGPPPPMRSGRMTATAAAVIAAATGSSLLRQSGGAGAGSAGKAADAKAGGVGVAGGGVAGRGGTGTKNVAGAAKLLKQRRRRRGDGGGGVNASSSSGERALTGKARQRREQRRKKKREEGGGGGGGRGGGGGQGKGSRAPRDRVKGGAAAKLIGSTTILPSGRVLSYSPSQPPAGGIANAGSGGGGGGRAAQVTPDSTDPSAQRTLSGSASGGGGGRVLLVPIVTPAGSGMAGSADAALDFVRSRSECSGKAGADAAASAAATDDVAASGTEGEEDDDANGAVGLTVRTEFLKVNEAARKEWDVGTERNSRYCAKPASASPMDGGNGVGGIGGEYAASDSAAASDAAASDSAASIPSAMAASEVFHTNAKEAIRALLTSPGPGGLTDGLTLSPVVSGVDRYGCAEAAARQDAEDARAAVAAGVGLDVSALTGAGSAAGSDVSATPAAAAASAVAPIGPTGSALSCVSTQRSVVHPSHSTPALGQSHSTLWSDTSGYVRPPEQPLLKPGTEAKLDTLRERLVVPAAQTADLIAAIRRPVAVDESTGVAMEASILARGYMTRRKNAVGAVKMLLHRKANRVPLCWTAGLLTSLTSVLNDAGPDGAEKEFAAADRGTYRAYIEARKRAVAALLSMATEPENRVLMFHSPGLVQALGKVIREERAECRRGCCAILANLSRAGENRLIVPKVPGIVEAMESVLRPKSYGRKGRGGPDGTGGASPSRVKRLMKHWSSVKSHDEEDDGDDDDRSVSSRISIKASETMLMSDDDEEEEAVEMMIDFNDDDQDDEKEEADSGRMEEGGAAGRAYDNDKDSFVHGARVYVFAALLCLLKEKANAHHLARCPSLMSTLITIASFHSSPSHVRATSVLSHMTRHSDNVKVLVTRTPNLLSVLVLAMSSPRVECRTQACRAVQNMAGQRSCRQEVANAFDLLEGLCACARGEGGRGGAWAASYERSTEEERRAAVGALKNLTDDPSNIIPMTNAGDCFATLMQIANGGAAGLAAEEEGDGEGGVGGGNLVTEEMQYMACDALATLSHWLRKIATSGVAGPYGPAAGAACGAAAAAGRGRGLFVPSNQVVGWEQWE